MKRMNKTTLTLSVLLGAAVLLGATQTSRAGDWSFSIGGLRFGSGSDYHHDRYYDRDYSYHRGYRSYHRPYYRSYHRSYPKVRDITPYPGHPPVYQIKPNRRHPSVIFTPRPYYPSGSCGTYYRR
jgi:hypothetical protein